MANFHVIAGATETVERPRVNHITLSDLADALRRGLSDFMEQPSHYALLFLIYPVVGIALAIWSAGFQTWPLLYPLMGGFALIGPIAAIGLYEISHRRENGMSTDWHHAFDVRKSPALPAIIAVGALLFVIFTLWLASAQALYEALFGPAPPLTFPALVSEVLTTPEGWTLVIAGNLIGLGFAVVALMTSVVSFPLLLDRDVGAHVAVWTSVRAVLKNPVPMLAWGLIVAASVFIGSIPFFVGLAVVLPVLGHSTWHLYRKVVAPPE